ncbi:MAG: peroxide stress protein YaaA [Bacteroidota bacterium]|nr:peroxide stress protein YaaA [Bacteroidota bacterium]|tara:strand:+ start:739 stop:1500 length:762 start_codon:yes stop_codon:yes gene_type:complete
MKIVISPAKSINLEKKIPTEKSSLPFFLDDAVVINSNLKKKSPLDLSSIMNISSKLSDLNWRRNQEFKIPFNKNNARPAIYAFDGDVYSGIDSYSLNQKKIDIIQERLFIISGLYGLLKPLDLIQPYRLEMGTKFEFNSYKNLYEFWTEKITEKIVSECKPDELLINLASNEYFSAINLGKIKSEIITPKFLDFKNGKLKMISFYAKKARGLMVRFLIDNNITKLEGILKFNSEGYSYSESETNNLNQPVFVR